VADGPAIRSAKFLDSFGEILFTFDLDGVDVLVEVSPQGDLQRYRNASIAVQEFLKAKLHTNIRFWPSKVELA
jgi:hypothetical protein